MSLEKDITQIKTLIEQDDIFKAATPGQLAKRIENNPELRRQKEEREKFEREEAIRQAERARDPWKYDHTGVAVRGRACGVCNQNIKKGERFFKVTYSGRYGHNHKAICKNCIAKALQKLEQE